jgi:hypothetical protein
LHINGNRPGPGTYSCPTPLSPEPTCNSDHSACVCVDDSDCSSGKCLSAGQCTGACTGFGAADKTQCELVTASMASEAGTGDANAMDADASNAGSTDAFDN